MFLFFITYYDVRFIITIIIIIIIIIVVVVVNVRNSSRFALVGSIVWQPYLHDLFRLILVHGHVRCLILSLLLLLLLLLLLPVPVAARSKA